MNVHTTFEPPFYTTVPALAAYINRIDAKEINFRNYMVREEYGHYYKQKGLAKLAPDGTITTTGDIEPPTDAEQEAIKAAFAGGIEMPRSIEFRPQQMEDLLELMRFRHRALDVDPNGAPKHWEFYNQKTGLIQMVQQRINTPDGKTYQPWSFYGDGKFRPMEPDGELPFWKPKEPTGKTKIMVHEGPKAAEAAQKIADDPNSTHAWAATFSDFEHWGIAGGALSPHRANYKELHDRNLDLMVYFCDNDQPGKSAPPTVSKKYGRRMKCVLLDDSFPEHWDIADDMPPKMFAADGRYIGKQPKEFMRSCTFATIEIPPKNGKGRPGHKLNPEFGAEWWTCRRPDVFVHVDLACDVMNADEFNKRNAPYSDVKDTAALLNKRAESAAAGLKFDPSSKAGRIAGGYNADFINTHVGPGIEPMDGDCSILQAYFDHAFPDLDDQKKVVRWAATLVCHPEIKMHYSLLLIGKQGVGKSTLADILTPLIGEWNCSRPNIKMVSEGNFNEWCAHKRVAVIAEVHEGHGGKGYDRLKDVITDATIDVHKKYQDTYSIDNWMHIIACSNSMRALKLDGEDRRWLVPRVTEQTRDPGEWTALRDWLNKQNGYAKTLWWFRRWLEENGGPVQRSDHAPMTTMKQDVLKENYTKGEDLTLETIERMLEANSEKSILWFDTDMRAHISRTHHGGRMDHVESADKIRKVALSAGQHVIKHRIQYRRGHRWYRAARTMALTNDPALVGLKRDELLRRVQASEVVFVNVNEEF